MALLAQVELLPNVVAGLLLTTLGVAVFIARPGRSVNRAFAVVAVSAGLVEFLFGLDTDADALPARLVGYLNIVVPFAALYLTFQMVLCYKAVRVPAGVRNGVFLVLTAACLFLLWLYATERHLFVVRDPVTGSYSPGPLDVFTELKYVTFAVLSLTFAVMTRGTKLGLSCRSLAQAALAFSLMPAYLFGFMGPFTIGATAEELLRPSFLFLVAGGPLVFAAGMTLARNKVPATAVWGGRLLWAAGGACLTGLLNGLLFVFEPFPLWYWPHFMTFGLWYLVMGALLAAPVLKDRVLDVDFKVEKTLQRGIFGACFLAVVFVASQLVQQGAEQYADSYGGILAIVGGGVVAGLMLFAIMPLQRVAERMVHRAVPPERPVTALADGERISIFEEQAALAWADGTLSRYERLHLDRLGQSLGIPAAQREAIERRALGITARGRTA